MADKTYTVRFKQAEINTQKLTGANAEVCGDHLLLLNSNGELVALFDLQIVESWTVTNPSKYTPEGFSGFVPCGGSDSLPAA